MQADNNLAPGVNDNHHIFNSEDLGEKECTECNGTGQVPDEMFNWEEMDSMITWERCGTCIGKGVVPKTEDDVLDEREARLEPNDL